MRQKVPTVFCLFLLSICTTCFDKLVEIGQTIHYGPRGWAGEKGGGFFPFPLIHSTQFFGLFQPIHPPIHLSSKKPPPSLPEFKKVQRRQWRGRSQRKVCVFVSGSSDISSRLQDGKKKKKNWNSAFLLHPDTGVHSLACSQDKK